MHDALFTHLNPPQHEAVTHTTGPLLILAGAGSGKTRVITHRAIYLIDSGVARADEILAVTFTNKAALEMRERVDALLDEVGRPEDSTKITISTFHSLGARILRRHADRLDLSWSFQIYDDQDQYKVIRALLKSKEMETDTSNIRRMAAYIERMKNRGYSPERAHETAHNQQDEEFAWFYEDYQKQLRQDNCLDFGDLILGVLEIFRKDPALASAYSKQWRFLMVDEFQDTNPAQYELLSYLTSEHDNLAVVGDDDQAIYRWRGATIANILGFEHDYKGARIIKLEQNYRSTQIILDAADDVIQHNSGRRDKKLWTDKQGGDKITLFTASDDREEAQYVVEKIQIMRARQQLALSDFAIFFRTNAQARHFEEQLRFAALPYQIVGGTSFYQRQEIKDLLAYLKVALNLNNQVDLLRIINTPSRGVGDSTIARLTNAAQIPGIHTVYNAIRYLLGADFTFEGELNLIEPDPQDFDHDMSLEELEGMRTQQLEGIKDFYNNLQTLRDDLLHFESLAEILRQFIERIHYLAYISAKFPDSAEDKSRNVGELINAIEEFEKTYDEEEPPPGSFLEEDMIDTSESMLSDATAVRKLRAFLDQSALVQAPNTGESSDEESDAPDGRVTLMTVHGSKGLEFEVAFLVGMEDELFPSIRDSTDHEELAEERRLAYVAITRAKQKLTMTNAKRRRIYGTFKDTAPSRFLLDIKPDRIEIDAKSVANKVDWRTTRQKKKMRAGGDISDEERYFSDGQIADAHFDFDQSQELDAVSPGASFTPDEFSQIPDESWANQDETTFEIDRGSSGDAFAEELIGQTVLHKAHGIGQIKAVSGEGDMATITVDFPTAGEKKVIYKFLKVIG